MGDDEIFRAKGNAAKIGSQVRLWTGQTAKESKLFLADLMAGRS